MIGGSQRPEQDLFSPPHDGDSLLELTAASLK